MVQEGSLYVWTNERCSRTGHCITTSQTEEYTMDDPGQVQGLPPRLPTQIINLLHAIQRSHIGKPLCKPPGPLTMITEWT